MKKLYWRIREQDSFETIFEMRVDLGQFTQNQMKQLLRALTARAGLNEAEIIGAFAKRKTKIANDLLLVQADPRYPTYSCGENPSFHASVVDEHGQITKFPPLDGLTSTPATGEQIMESRE